MMSHIESRDKSLYESRDESHAPNPAVLVTFHWVVCDSQSNQKRFQQEEEAEGEAEAESEAAGEDVCSPCDNNKETRAVLGVSLIMLTLDM